MHLVALVMEFQYENEFAHRCPAIFESSRSFSERIGVSFAVNIW
jgi:hypothetical protein